MCAEAAIASDEKIPRDHKRGADAGQDRIDERQELEGQARVFPSSDPADTWQCTALPHGPSSHDGLR